MLSIPAHPPDIELRYGAGGRITLLHSLDRVSYKSDFLEPESNKAKLDLVVHVTGYRQTVLCDNLPVS
jgi:hypothetical protein